MPLFVLFLLACFCRTEVQLSLTGSGTSTFSGGGGRDGVWVGGGEVTLNLFGKMMKNVLSITATVGNNR